MTRAKGPLAPSLASTVAVTVVGLTLVAGCPPPTVSGPPSRRPPRRRIVPRTVVKQVVRLEATAAVPAEPRPSLPPFPRFRDPYPLPKRSLKRERRLGFTARGRARLRVHTHLAARLWRMANRNIDRIRRLEARARRRNGPVDRDRIARLRRVASAHLQECVTLLDGVLEVKGAPIMARVRLAHYLRKLKPSAAIPHFYVLVRDPKAPGPRGRYAVDLAQLLVSSGRSKEAWSVLERYTRGVRSPRAALLRALARARALRGRGTPGRALRTLAEGADRLPPAVKASFRNLLPELMAALRAPAPFLQRLARHAPNTWRKHGSTLAARGARRLLLEGRPSVAAALLRAARARGARVDAALRNRVTRAGGPWGAQGQPPDAQRWRRLVRARLPSLYRCFGRAPSGTRTLRLRIGPEGTVTPPRAASRPPPARKSAPEPCVRRETAAWRFPGWRAPRAVALRVVVTFRPLAEPAEGESH